MVEIKCAHSEVLPISELKQKFHPKNPNVHPDEQLDRLAAILKYQGIRKPATISKRSGLITAGHGRIVAAERAGAATFPVDYQDYDSDEQEYADLTADNAIASWAELDLSGINAHVPELGPDFDLDMLGIKDFTLDLAEKLEPQCDEDEVPEQADTRVKLGDVWTLGKHRLMCGDSTAITDVERLMAGEKADMVFTDPPYGMNLNTDFRSMGSKNNFKRIEGDGDDFKPELIQVLLGIFNYCDEVFLFGADYYAELIERRNEGSWVVWDKRSHGEENIGTLDGSFGADFELCWSKYKHQRKICRVIRNKGAFIKRREGVDTVHPSQKPVEMVCWFFDQWGKDRKNVVDLYGGSGSTLIACEKTNRRCFMMEIDPHYCDIILARWEKYTGKTAERAQEGVTDGV